MRTSLADVIAQAKVEGRAVSSVFRGLRNAEGGNVSSTTTAVDPDFTAVTLAAIRLEQRRRLAIMSRWIRRGASRR